MLNGFRPTGQHFLHVDFAQLEQVSQPLTILQFGHLLQTEQKEWEVGAILQWMSHLCNADQLSNDGSRRKLCQVRLQQWDFFFNLRTLVQNTQNGLSNRCQD